MLIQLRNWEIYKRNLEDKGLQEVLKQNDWIQHLVAFSKTAV